MQHDSSNIKIIWILSPWNKPHESGKSQYIPTKNGMTHLRSIQDIFSKEWYGYNYNASYTAKDAI
jgi:hypothetical protein